MGLSNFSLSVDDGIVISLQEPFRVDLPGVGYLRTATDQPSSIDFLPIYLVWDDTRTRAVIKVSRSRDFEPIPAKVGGAFYSGEDSRLDSIFWGHVPTFDGSIGFRCAYDVP